MFRTGGAVLKRIAVAGGIDSTSQNAVCVVAVRGRARKPWWTGPAKTKLFKIPQRPILPPDEEAEIRRLEKQHKCLMRSISAYYKEENERQAAGSKIAEEEIQAEVREWEQCLLRNETWNKEVAKTREERLAKEHLEREQEVLKTIMEQEAKQKQILEQVEALVRHEKELSKTYITPENIDSAIRYALENPVDYNFAVDTQGKIYAGRFTKPTSQDSSPSAPTEIPNTVPHQPPPMKPTSQVQP